MKKLVLIIFLFSLVFMNVGCKPEIKEYGELYSINEAYEKGYLTKSDMSSIQNFYKKPEAERKLDKETEFKIKASYVTNYNKFSHDEITIDQVEITDYYGTYNGYVVFIMEGPWGYADGLEYVEVGGLVYNLYGPYYEVWKEY